MARLPRQHKALALKVEGKKNVAMTDWREKEREFLTSLKADTGRDLGEWMRVIAAQNLPHRNDIIDWLRQQGFPFSRASWLERIHHNQGRPIYCDLSEVAPSAAALEVAEEVVEVHRVAAAGGGRIVVAAAPPPKPPDAQTPERAAPERKLPLPRLAATGPEAKIAAPPEAAQAPDPARTGASRTNPPRDGAPGTRATATDAAARDEVLAKAKAYRPLAVHLLRLIEDAVGDVVVVPGAGHLALSRAGQTFGIVAVSPKDIRLVVRLDPEVASAPFGPVKLPVTLAQAAQGLTHMAVLDDARQIDEALINLVRRAAGA